jgi:hypothetical protein
LKDERVFLAHTFPEDETNANQIAKRRKLKLGPEPIGNAIDVKKNAFQKKRGYATSQA